MNNKIYKWLAITLLMSVSVFCYLYLTKVQTNNTTNTPAAADTTPSDKPADEIPEPVHYNTLPREAENIDGYILQNIGGAKNEDLKAAYKISDEYYLFFDTYSNGGDIKSECPSAAAALLDSNLTLSRTAAFSGQSDENIEAVKLIDNAFVIAAASQNYVALYKINFDLITIGKIAVESAADADLYYQNGDVFLIMAKENSLCIKQISVDFEIKSTSSLPVDNPRAVQIFPSSNGFNIFADSSEGYFLARYKYEGGFAAVSTVNGYSLKEVLPFGEGFAGLRESDGGTELFITDRDFAVTNSINILSDSAYIFIKENSIILYETTGETAVLSYYCCHLDKLLSIATNYYEKLCYTDYTGATVAAFRGNNMHIISIENAAVTVKDNHMSSYGFAKVLYDGSIVFTSNYKSGIYRKNYGSNDVFIARKII